MLTGEFHQYSRINSRSMKFHFVSSNLKDFLISISFRFFEYLQLLKKNSNIETIIRSAIITPLKRNITPEINVQ